MSAEEIKAAIYSAVKFGVGGLLRREQLQILIDAADELIRRIEAEEAERAERDKPIDEAWLRESGFESGEDFGDEQGTFGLDVNHSWCGMVVANIGSHSIELWRYLSNGTSSEFISLDITTRGQLLDLLRALGINPEGGQS